MTYRCNKSFKSKDGKFYYYNEKISDARYKLLSDFEKRNFSKLEDEVLTTNNSSEVISLLDNEIIDTSIPDIPAPDYEQDRITPFDFGGGDTGGGGATNDW